MSRVRLIDRALLDEVSAAAKASPRRRMNHNFHPHNDFPGHRLLIGIEPGSYVAPHRHLDPHKDETMVVLRGRLGLVVFDELGAIAETALLVAGGSVGVDIPHGTFHTLLSLDSGTVFMEAKSGPYAALVDAERAPWAPPEGDAAAGPYLMQLHKLFE